MQNEPLGDKGSAGLWWPHREGAHVVLPPTPEAGGSSRGGWVGLRDQGVQWGRGGPGGQGGTRPERDWSGWRSQGKAEAGGQRAFWGGGWFWLPHAGGECWAGPLSKGHPFLSPAVWPLRQVLRVRLPRSGHSGVSWGARCGRA